MAKPTSFIFGSTIVVSIAFICATIPAFGQRGGGSMVAEAFMEEVAAVSTVAAEVPAEAAMEAVVRQRHG